MNPKTPRHVDDDLKAYVDGELNAVRRLRVARHLAACSTCRVKELEMKQVSEQLNRLDGADNGPLSPDLRANLLAQAPQGRAADNPVAKPLWRRSPGLVFGGGGVALAASFAAFATLYGTASNPPQVTMTTPAAAGESVAVAAGAQPMSGAPEAVPAPGAPSASTDADAATAYAYAPARAKTASSVAAADKITFSAPASSNGIIARRPLSQFGNSIPDLETRQVHREASLGVAVDNPEAASARVEMQVKEWGGFVASNNLNTDEGGYKSADLTLKVPEERFDEMLASVSKLGDVRFKNITGEDITEQTSNATSDEQAIIDQVTALEARLKAGNLSDRRTIQTEARVLQVQRELARTRTRLGLLRKLARLSTLSVTLTEKKKVEAGAAPTSGFWYDMKDSNRAALKAFQAAVRVPLLLAIWAVALCPLWLPLLLTYRHIARKQAQAALAEARATAPPTETANKNR